MLNAAFVALAVAVLFGSLLAVRYLREAAAPPPWPFGALHGLIAIAGLAMLASHCAARRAAWSKASVPSALSPPRCWRWRR